MTKVMLHFTSAGLMFILSLSPAQSLALESFAQAPETVMSTVWLDNQYCRTSQSEAAYYLADYADTSGGFTVTLNYADTQTRRLEANIRSLSFCEIEYFGEYRSYFKSGELLEKGEFDPEGLRQGWVVVFNRDEQFVRRIPYVDNLVHGTYTTYRDGNVYRVEEVAHGQRHGNNKLYFPSGKLRRDMNHQRGQRHGELREWNEQGNLVHIASYHEGKLHGKEQRFFASGELRSSAEFEYGQAVGEHINYHAPGKPSRERIYDENGQSIVERRYTDNSQLNYARESTDTPHGKGVETRYYHPNGELSSSKIVNDEMDWQLSKRYSDEGQLTERSERIHGRPVGAFVRRGWSHDLQYGSYKDGLAHGHYYTTDDKGEVRTEGTYDHGVKIGRWVERDRYQTVVEHYDDDGNLHGTRKEYNLDGTLKIRAHYTAGTLHGSYLQYADQRIINAGEFVDGKREGDWIISPLYSPVSGATHHGRYINDQQVGRWLLYNEYGHRLAIHQFNLTGERHGRQLEFESNGALRLLQEFQNGVEHGLRVYYQFGETQSKVRYENGYYVGDIE